MATRGHIVAAGISDGMIERMSAKSECAKRMAIGRISPAIASVC